MGMELVRTSFKEEDIEFLALPPGFESFTSYKLKSMEETKKEVISAHPPNPSMDPGQVKTEMSDDDTKTISRLLRRRPVNYSQCSIDSDDDPDPEQLDQNFQIKSLLPKGVFRGCSDCETCQKVVARCKPDAARRPNLEEVPVFTPSEEEFQDTINYIAKIRPMAEPYGICRIIPPSSWKPPCQLKERNIWENSKFSTRVQRVDKLQNRVPARKMSRVSNQMRKKRRRCSKMGVDSGVGCESVPDPMQSGFGFEPGPGFTLDAFQRYADDFKGQYFEGREDIMGSGTDSTKVFGKSNPSIETLEGEYWRVVEKPTEELEVLYGADLETGSFGSGFPKSSVQDSSSCRERYVNSGWNLNNLPRVQGSVLSYENPDISGVQVPWLYVGMCFSSFCWHVEDHYLYSLNYLHFGAPKLWYGVPGKDASKLEDAMRKHLPELFKEQPDLLHKLVTQLSPSILKSEGVPVYRCIQNPGEFVLTFPRAYHAGFNCGFNCAEAVNVAPLDWFPHGQNAVELYREQGRKTTISHDKLLLGAATDAVRAHWELSLLRKNTADNLRWKDVCGRNGVLAKSLKARVDIERVRRDFLCKSSKVLKMLSSFDATTERECNVCSFDLHLSAVACRCSPDKYACLNHSKQLCPCSWNDKFFLFRYDIDELDLLVEAVEGKLSAVYKWAKSYLGFSLSSDTCKDNSQVPGPTTASLLSDTKEGLCNDTISQPLKEASGEKISAVGGKLAGSYSPVKDVKVDPQGSISSRGKPSSRQDFICLSDDEGDEIDKPLSDSGKQTSISVGGEPVKHINTSNDTRNENTGNCGGQTLHKESVVSSHQKSNTASPNSSGLSDCNSEGNALGVIVGLSAPQINKNRDEVSTQRVDQVKFVGPARSLPGSPSGGQNGVGKPYCQKGLRIAKVVRRISCNVEALQLGNVVPGKSWSNGQAIFPKGFRSRVRYINILDPTSMCDYISEVVDGGSKGPLFMVSLEPCPSEVFAHVSPTRCWEMVLERVNREIARHHKLGRLNLPPLQPPGSVDGFEMFGFSSPSVIQAIEALDRNRVCREYWNCRPLAKVSRCLQAEDDNIPNGHSKSNEDPNVDGSDAVVRGLFMKANPEELHSLVGILKDGRSASTFLTQLLNEEIHRRLG